MNLFDYCGFRSALSYTVDNRPGSDTFGERVQAMAKFRARNVPNDIGVLIAKFLGPLDLARSVCLLSKGWRRFATEPKSNLVSHLMKIHLSKETLKQKAQVYPLPPECCVESCHTATDRISLLVTCFFLPPRTYSARLMFFDHLNRLFLPTQIDITGRSSCHVSESLALCAPNALEDERTKPLIVDIENQAVVSEMDLSPAYLPGDRCNHRIVYFKPRGDKLGCVTEEGIAVDYDPANKMFGGAEPAFHPPDRMYLRLKQLQLIKSFGLMLCEKRVEGGYRLLLGNPVGLLIDETIAEPRHFAVAQDKVVVATTEGIKVFTVSDGKCVLSRTYNTLIDSNGDKVPPISHFLEDPDGLLAVHSSNLLIRWADLCSPTLPALSYDRVPFGRIVARRNFAGAQAPPRILHDAIGSSGLGLPSGSVYLHERLAFKSLIGMVSVPGRPSSGRFILPNKSNKLHIISDRHTVVSGIITGWTLEVREGVEVDPSVAVATAAPPASPAPANALPAPAKRTPRMASRAIAPAPRGQKRARTSKD